MAAEDIPRPFVVVGICTRGRDALLRRLLTSLEQQKVADRTNVVLRIIDNNTARSIPDDLFGIISRFPFAIIHEPKAGLVNARNALTDEAERIGADWLIGIDDDEWVDPFWLAQWLRGLDETEADILVGTAELIFDETVSPLHPQRQFRQPIVDQRPAILGTCNYAMRRRVFDRVTGLGLRFDPRFNLTGGEDSELMLRAMRQHNATVSGWPYPKAYEERTGERGKITYQLSRVMRDQVNAYRIVAAHCASGIMPKGSTLPLVVLRLTNRNLVFALGYFLAALGKLVFRPSEAQRTFGLGLQYLARSLAVFPFLANTSLDAYGTNETPPKVSSK